MARKISDMEFVGKITGKGLKVYKGKVVEAIDISGTDSKGGFQYEIGVGLKVEVGYESPIAIEITGRYHYKDDIPSGIKGQANSDIAIFLTRINGNDASFNDDWTLRKEQIKAAIGKEIYILQYSTKEYTDKNSGLLKAGKKYYGRIGVKGEEELTKEFLDSVERGFPQDYDPTVWDRVKNENKDEEGSFDANKFAKAQSDFDEEVATTSI